MIILTLRTDKPHAELGLYSGERKLGYLSWPAHRQLAETIHSRISEILNPDKKYLAYQVFLNGAGSSRKLKLSDIEGVVVFKGPGSFTGLRIGISVANALAYGLRIPVVARAGGKWAEQGIADLLAGQNDKAALPAYGSAAKTTRPKR